MRRIRRRRRVRYARSPVGNAQLQPITWPLIDSLAVDNTTAGEKRFYQDAIGTNGKHRGLTTMEKAGSLAHPKLFDIHGAYLAINQALKNFTTALADADPLAVPDEANAVLGILYTTYYQLHVGEKDYLLQPSFLFPSNYHLTGGAVGANVPSASDWRTIHLQTTGMEYSIKRRRVRLLPDQTFYAALHFPLTGGGVPSGAGRVVHSVLNGILFRETQ